MIRLTSDNTFTIDAAAGDAPRRQISGVAVEYGKTATVSDGTKVMFMPGSLLADGKNPKLYMQHDSAQIIGQVTERQDVGTAMMFVAKISATRLGDEALILAGDGTIDSVSVGVNPTKWHDENGVMVIEAATWQELSLVSQPAFEGSVITQVAASIHENEPEVSNVEPEPIEENSTMSIIETPAPEIITATAPVFAAAKREPRIPNSWEYMAAFHKGGDDWVNAQKVFADYTAFHKSPLQAVVAALGARAMPQTPSSTFNRPTITTHQATATAQTEGSAVATATGVIANNTVTKKTFANSANISYQTLDFTDPAALQIVINDLIGGYMVGTDNEAADNLLTAATSAGVWDLTVADLYKSIYDAAIVTLAATNMLPTHMFVDPATYSLIMQLKDTTDRPLFANLGGGLSGQNAIGVGNATSASVDGRNDQGPLGLKLVVDNNFAAKTMVIMKDIGFEVYEDWKGILSVDAPTTLTRAVSTHGYFCTFKANGSMIQKITQA